MVTEHAVLEIMPGQEEGFLAAFEQASEVIAAAPGCRGVALHRCVESPSRFLLLVGWDTVEAHTEDFRGSAAFGRWRALVGPFFAGPPQVDHYETVRAPDPR